MNDSPLHPLIVHVPLVLAFVVPFVVAACARESRRAPEARGAFLPAFGLALIVALGGFAGLRTGEQDEELVERVVPESALHEHEERGELFTISAGVVALALGLASFARGRVSRVAALAGGVGSVVVALIGVTAGKLGGELVYRHGAASVHVERATGVAPADAPRPASAASEGESDD